MKLRDLLAGIPLEGKQPDLEMEINSISINGEGLAPHTLWVDVTGDPGQLRGALTAGATVIAARAHPGCMCTDDPWRTLSQLGANWYCRPGRHMVLLAVAGQGDTELAAHLLREMLERLPHLRVGMVDRERAWINGVPLPAGQREAGGLCVQRLLRRMADEGCTHVILHPDEGMLARQELAGLRLSLAALIGPAPDGERFKQLLMSCDTVVCNLDERGWQGCQNLLPAGVFTYSENKDRADLVAKNLRVFPGHVEFEGVTVGQIQRIHLPVCGGFTVYHGLFVLACGLCLGLKLEPMARVLRSARGLQRRLEVLPVPAAYTVVLDQADTPQSLERLLTCAREFTAGRLVCVLSCSGDGDAARRPQLGSVAEQLADRIVLTAPEGERGDRLLPIRQVRSGTGGWRRPCSVEPDPQRAIRSALDGAGPGDVIVLAVPTGRAGCGAGFPDEREIVAGLVRHNRTRRYREADAGL